MTMDSIDRGMRRARWRGMSVLLVAATTLVAFAVCARPVHAQGAPAVPNPITTNELLQFADLMDLSDSQRLALGPILDEYGRQFRQLREGEVEAYIDTLIRLAVEFIPSGMRIPEREKLEAIVDGYQRLLPRIESIDRMLFSRIETMCSDEQIAAAERCKVLRAIEVHDMIVIDGPFGEMNQCSTPRLTTMVEQLDLDPDTSSRVDPVLATYETALLGELRRLHDVIEKTILRALDIIDELGFRNMETAELMQYFQDEQNQATMMERFNEESKPLQAQLHDVARLNDQTFRRVLALVPPDAQEQLRQSYFERAYGQAYNGPGAWRGRYTKAAQLDWLDAERREVIAAERQRFVTADDAICDEIASELMRSRAYRTAEQMDGGDWSNWEKYRDDRTALQERADQRLDTILGPQDLERFNRSHETAQALGSGGAITNVVTVSGAGGSELRTTVSFAGPRTTNSGFPARMDAHDRDRITRVTSLDEADAMIVEALFEDYRTAYDAAIEEVEAAMGTAREIGDAVKRDQELRSVESAARERLAGIDREFFASVTALLTDDGATAHADRLRRLRVRQRARTTGRGFWSNAEGEASVDLVQLVYDKLREPGTFTPALAAALDGYAVDADRNMEDRAKAANDIARRLAMMERLRQRESGDDAARQQVMETMQENWRQAISAVRRADRAQAETNRAYLDQVLAALPEDLRWTTEYDYRLAAYPDIYRESMGIESAFSRALEIPDLADSQRVRVAESLTAYRDRFRRLSDRMIELRQDRDQMDFDFRPNREMMERELELMRLRFERKELGERASFDLTMLLDPHQRETLGSFPPS